MLECCGITLDESAYTATLHGEALSLTPKEFAILACLMRDQGRPVASRDLFESVWGEIANAQSNNTVMVHIRHLRSKIEIDPTEPRYLKVVWGKGYKMEERRNEKAAR